MICQCSRPHKTPNEPEKEITPTDMILAIIPIFRNGNKSIFKSEEPAHSTLLDTRGTINSIYARSLTEVLLCQPLQPKGPASFFLPLKMRQAVSEDRYT